jgi:hypothetical protein
MGAHELEILSGWGVGAPQCVVSKAPYFQVRLVIFLSFCDNQVNHMLGRGQQGTSKSRIPDATANRGTDPVRDRRKDREP